MSNPRDPMNPQVAQLLAMMGAGRGERVLEPEPMRAGLGALAPMLTAGAPAVARERERRIPGPGGEIRIRVFEPAGDGPHPCVVYFHGGGYVIMSPETHEKLTKEIAVGVGAVVVSVDYRLAPEHPFPAPLDDCVAALRWVREQATELGIDPDRIAVAGDSAGGNASAGVCLRLAADGEALPRAAVLLCPWTDMSLDTESHRVFGPDDGVLDTDLMHFFRDAYVKPDQITDPFASVIRGDLARFPKSLVVVGGIDPLRDDGLEFAKRLEAAGRDVTLDLFDDMPHDFMLFPGIDAGPECVGRVNAFLKSALG